ncbi:MAG: hypothetical protein QOI92_2677 [Chloroflexota bacterium]|nr:hypothetical protein [Chloroflexota bacterium]
MPRQHLNPELSSLEGAGRPRAALRHDGTPSDMPSGAAYLESVWGGGDRGSAERAILGLQRRVGNAAVSRAARAHETAKTRASGPIVAQRDNDEQSFMGGQPTSFLAPQATQSFMGGDAKQSSAGPGFMTGQGAQPSFLAPQGPPSFMNDQGDKPKAAQAAPQQLLSEGERIELRRLTGDRLGRAFTAFAIAAEQNRAAIKAAEKDGGGFADILLEVLLGALLPGISRGLAHMAEELPAAASNVSYRIAMQAMKDEQTTKALEIGVKVGREYLKGVGTNLAGEDEMDAFLNHLQDHFNKSADRIDQSLPSLSDQALSVMYAAYNPEVAGQEQFRTAIQGLVQKYQKQVKPIGTTEYHWMNRQSNFMLYWVIGSGGSKRLALLENQSFKEWVSPELQSVAIQKFKTTFAGNYYKGIVPEIEAKIVDDLRG